MLRAPVITDKAIINIMLIYHQYTSYSFVKIEMNFRTFSSNQFVS